MRNAIIAILLLLITSLSLSTSYEKDSPENIFFSEMTEKVDGEESILSLRS